MTAPRAPVELRDFPEPDFVRAIRVLAEHHQRLPWRRIRARTYPLAAVNEALADAEAVGLPKALVQPN